MSEHDEIRQAHRTILTLLIKKSPWLNGKEREFRVVEGALLAMDCEWPTRDDYLRRKNE